MTNPLSPASEALVRALIDDAIEYGRSLGRDDEIWEQETEAKVMSKSRLKVTEHIALLEADARRLDWLEAQGNGDLWVARQSDTGRGFRLHNSDALYGHPTARQAIDHAAVYSAAVSEGSPSNA